MLFFFTGCFLWFFRFFSLDFPLLWVNIENYFLKSEYASLKYNLCLSSSRERFDSANCDSSIIKYCRMCVVVLLRSPLDGHWSVAVHSRVDIASCPRYLRRLFRSVRARPVSNRLVITMHTRCQVIS